MEGVPRMPMLEVELKHNSFDYTSLDWAGGPSEDVHEAVQAQISEALKKHIRDEYGDNPDKFNDAIDKFIEVQTAAYKAVLSPDFEGCNSLKKYYGQLHYMQTRFPFTGEEGLKVTFTWQDAFTGILTVHETFAFEQASILFNIGAVHSILGAADSRITEDGIRISCVHFQCAAGLFTYIADNLDTTLSPDISQQMLKLFINVMLAQGQECLLEKSMQDNRKHSIVSKISQQVVDYYKLCLQYLENREAENVLGSSAYKAWRRMITFKISYYSAITKYFMGNNSLDQDKYGQAVSYFGGAVVHMTELTKQAKGFPKEIRTKIDEALRFTSDVLNGKYNSSVKDNNFVYHDKVPDVATLPEAKGASLVKALPFEPANEALTGPDIFAKLVPMEAHLAASSYSEEKAKLLRTVVEKVEEKDEILSQYKNSIELDPKKLINPDETARLSQDLIEKCASFSVDQTPIAGLKEAMEGMGEVYSDLDSVLNDILTLIESEETEDLKFQEVAGKEAFSIQDDVEGIKRELAAYKELYQKASSRHQDLNTACRIHIHNMKTVAGGLDSLKEELKLTDIGKLLTEEDRSVIDSIKKLCEKVVEMEEQRDTLLKSLRNQMETDDVTSTLVTKHGIDQEDLFQEELKKYDSLIDTIHQNLAAQGNILNAVTEANARYAKIRKIAENEKERVEQKSKNLVLSCEASDDVKGKCVEGKKFFGEILGKASELLRRAKEFQEDNEAERKKIYKKIEEKKKPPPPRPSAPKPNLNVPRKPATTPAPSPGMVLSPDVLAKMMAEDEDELLNDPEFLQFLQNQGDLQSMQLPSSLPGSAPPDPATMATGFGHIPSRPQSLPPRSHGPNLQSPIYPAAVSSPTPAVPQNYPSARVATRPTPQVMSPQPQTYVPPHAGQVSPGPISAMTGQQHRYSQYDQMPDPRQSPNLPHQVTASHTHPGQSFPMQRPVAESVVSGQYPDASRPQPHPVSSPMPQQLGSAQPPAHVMQHSNRMTPGPSQLPLAQVSVQPQFQPHPQEGPLLRAQMPPVGSAASQAMQYVPQQLQAQHGIGGPQSMAPTQQPATQMAVPVSQQTYQPAGVVSGIGMSQARQENLPGQAVATLPQQALPGAQVAQPQALQHNYHIPQQNTPTQKQQPIRVSQVAIVYSSQPPNQQSVGTTCSMPTAGHAMQSTIPAQVQYSQSDSMLMKSHPNMTGYPSPALTPSSFSNSQPLPPSSQPYPVQYPQPTMTPQPMYAVSQTPPLPLVSPNQSHTSQQYNVIPQNVYLQQYPQQQVTSLSQSHHAQTQQQLSTPNQGFNQSLQPGRNPSQGYTSAPVNAPPNHQPSMVSQPQNQRQQLGGQVPGGPQEFPAATLQIDHQPTMVSQQPMIRPPAPQRNQQAGINQVPSSIGPSVINQAESLRIDQHPSMVSQQPMFRPPAPQQNQQAGINQVPNSIGPSVINQAEMPRIDQQPTMVSQQPIVRPPAPQQNQQAGIHQVLSSVVPTVINQARPGMPYQTTPQGNVLNFSGQQVYHPPQQNFRQSAPAQHQAVPHASTVSQQTSPHAAQQGMPPVGQNVPQHSHGQPLNQVHHPPMNDPGVVAHHPRMPNPSIHQGTGQVQPSFQPASNAMKSSTQQPWSQNVQTPASQAQNIPQLQQPSVQPLQMSNPQSSASMSRLPEPTQYQPLRTQNAPQEDLSRQIVSSQAQLPPHSGQAPNALQQGASNSTPASQERYVFKSHPHPGQVMSTPSNENSPKHMPTNRQSTQGSTGAVAQLSEVLTPTPVNPPQKQEPGPKQPSSDLAGLVLTPTRTLSSSADELLFTSPDQNPVPAKNTAQLVLVPIKIDEVDEKMVVRPIEGLPYMEEADLMKFKSQVSEFRTKVSNLLQKPSNHGLCELDKEWKQLSEAQEKYSRQLSTAIARCSSYKNRFQDIVPFDQSRVILKEAKDDYINASVIDGVSPYCPRFIATQSPLPNTVSDFWTMVYEQNINLVVMLVNTKDVPKKCPMYWPTDRAVPQQHGPLTISFTTSKTHGDLYVERTFTIKHKMQSLAMSITQLQYIAWPEHRFPSSASDLLSFVSVVQGYHISQRNLQWPVLVHCESGVGRTGVFCAFMAGISEIDAGIGVMDVLEIVNKMRQKRKYMVQEKAQLKFVYDVVLFHAVDILKQRNIVLIDEAKPVPPPQLMQSQLANPQTAAKEFDIFSDLSALSSIQANVEKMTIKPGVEKPMPKSDLQARKIESKSCSDIPNSDQVSLRLEPVIRPSTSEMYHPNDSELILQNPTQQSDLVQGTMTSYDHGYHPPLTSEITPPKPDIVESCSGPNDTKPPEPQQPPSTTVITSSQDNSSSPLSLIESLTPESFTLDTEQDAGKKKQKISKEDFFKPKQGLSSENDPSDPFSGLDPLWGLRK